MPRDWNELFITAADGDHAAKDEREESAAGERAGKRGGLFRRLRESMTKTRQALGSEIQATLFGVLDEQTWERLEEALIMADVGASTTAAVVQTLETEASEGKLEGGEALSQRLIELLAQTATVGEARIDIRAQPTVIMAVGLTAPARRPPSASLHGTYGRSSGAACYWGPQTPSGPPPASSSRVGHSEPAVRS